MTTVTQGRPPWKKCRDHIKIYPTSGILCLLKYSFLFKPCHGKESMARLKREERMEKWQDLPERITIGRIMMEPNPNKRWTGKNGERRLQWHREQIFNQKLSNGKEHKTVVKSSVILLQKGLNKTDKINFRLIMCLVEDRGKKKNRPKFGSIQIRVSLWICRLLTRFKHQESKATPWGFFVTQLQPFAYSKNY